jgi:hypothetical protein
MHGARFRAKAAWLSLLAAAGLMAWGGFFTIVSTSLDLDDEGDATSTSCVEPAKVRLRLSTT